ncbi:IS110 family transposase [Vibrio sp. M260112]|uniref:IS110 family transposase n=2 Tax=unclassified Vibrio TaxID=2614977 RepID=UPI002F3E34B7
MTHSTVLAIDLAKNVFQVCKMDRHGRIIFNKEVSRKKLTELLIKEKASLIAMESCATAHHWGRLAIKLGHKVKAIAPKRVSAFRQGQKTDANDALAIAIAAMQPNVKACRILNIEDQCQQSIVHIRELLVRQKVSSANQLRALLLEFGFPINKGDFALRTEIPLILEEAENSLTWTFRETLAMMYDRFVDLVHQIDNITQKLKVTTSQDLLCKRLQALEGVGPICAALLKIALSQKDHFSKGRHASACLGLTPVQHSSGGKQKIGAIAKRCGNNTLRNALYNGAIGVVCKLEKREARTSKEQWLKAMTVRRGKKVAAIALANKTVRTAFAMIESGEDYKPQFLVA